MKVHDPAETATDLQQRLEFAVVAAREAGEFVLRYYQDAELAVETKQDESPVTVADRGAEELLRDRIERFYPEDGVFGEELDEKPSDNGYRWILDPIDGTQSFIRGVPLFGTLIALEQRGRVVIGVCRLPALDEVVYACEGGGAWWQKGRRPPRPARVSTVSSLREAIFCFTEIEGFEAVDRRETFDKLCAAVPLTRGWSDCYGHILVASGRADFMVDARMSPWDAAALLPILQEAGGHFLDWSGRPTISGGNGVSVNDRLRQAVVELLN